ncbi:MAG: M20/M25/M40 family metallo-hydrolase [Desulfosalsimonadaceae bacterium]
MQQEQGPADRIQAFFKGRQQAMYALLEELVLIQSGSRNKAGIDRMAAAVAAAMPGSMQPRILPFTEHGNMVSAKTRKAAEGAKQLLLLGHMDTVFPEDTDFHFYREDESRAYGPGVIDMKGGLVCAIYALKALSELGLLDELPVCMLCNSDEEIGSPASWGMICREADNAFAAFVMECAGKNGEIVTGRKGRSGYRLVVHGRSGHAAQAGGNKASAILELAHKTIALEALNDPPSVSLNVGVVKGGIGPNTVPGKADALIDIRYIEEVDGKRVKAEIDRILQSPAVPGTVCELQYQTGRPSMPQTPGNEDLFTLVQSQAALLGQCVTHEFRNGVSDANVVVNPSQ